MKIIIRVDASLEIGIGHVMRCLTLAQKLKEVGDKVAFICRKNNGDLVDKIRSSGFFVHELKSLKNNEEDHELFYSSWLGTTQLADANECVEIIKSIKPDWLIIDHYGLDEIWEKKLQNYCKKSLVIDDLGDRRHHCSVILDQNLGSTPVKYHELVDSSCKILTGPKYALLRDEFHLYREYSLARRENNFEIKTILVTFGGADSDNFTGKVLEQLSKCKFHKKTKIQVIMWNSAPHLETVKMQAFKMPFKTEVKTGVSNMAELMSNADLAIGASGSTTWERCCLGLPTIQIVISENQRLPAESLDKINAIKMVEKLEDIIFCIDTLDQWFFQVKKKCKDVVDGSGTSKVLEKIKLNN